MGWFGANMQTRWLVIISTAIVGVVLLTESSPHRHESLQRAPNRAGAEPTPAVEPIGKLPLVEVDPPVAPPVEPVPRIEKIKAKMEPYYAAAVEGQVIYECGLRDGSWSGALATNTRVLHGELMGMLSNEEGRELTAFQNRIARRIVATMAPQGVPGPAKCRDVADAELAEHVNATGLLVMPTPDMVRAIISTR